MAENRYDDYGNIKTNLEASVSESHFRPSREYRAVLDSLNTVTEMMEQNVERKTHENMLDAHQQLGNACDEYLKSRAGARTEKGQNRLEMVGALYNLQRQEAAGINGIRSPLAARENEGKTWKDAMANLRISEIDVTGQELDRVGGDVSSRYVVRTENGTGFFTPDQKVDTSLANYMRKQLGSIADPELREVMGQLSDYQYNGEVSAREDAARQTVDTVQNDHPPVYGDDCSVYEGTVHFGMQKDNSAENCMNIWMDNLEPQYKRDMSNIVKWESRSEQFKKDFQTQMIDCGKEAEITRNALTCAGLDDGYSLTDRNVASSRMAELMGQESLIARSTKVQIRDGEKLTPGIIMEKAVGCDARSSKMEFHQELSQVNDFSNPGFQKDLTNLAIMDYITGQSDRHAGNMFYQLSEPQDGVRAITGLQGIDNDLAFGGEFLDISKRVKLPEVTMVDQNMAEQLQGINRDMLDYTFGDLLGAEEINAIEKRQKDMVDHIQSGLEKGTVKLMDETDWNMDTAQELQQKHTYMKAVTNEMKTVRKDMELEGEKKTMEELNKDDIEKTKEEVELEDQNSIDAELDELLGIKPEKIENEPSLQDGISAAMPKPTGGSLGHLEYAKLQKSMENGAKGVFARPSKEYKDVLESLKALNQMRNNAEVNPQTKNDITAAYEKLGQACKTYLEEKNPNTSKGKERYNMIENVQNLCQQDQPLIATAKLESDKTTQSAAPANWVEAIDQARVAAVLSTSQERGSADKLNQNGNRMAVNLEALFRAEDEAKAVAAGKGKTLPTPQKEEQKTAQSTNSAEPQEKSPTSDSPEKEEKTATKSDSSDKRKPSGSREPSTAKWEERAPTAPYVGGRHGDGQLNYGNHHRSSNGPSK